MTAALIVIEMAAPQVSDDALSVLVSACTRAAREAECVLAKNASDQQPAAVAIVSQQAEDRLRVEVGVHQGDHDSWRTKDFSFLAADEPLDRWRAIGFAIGTLAESDAPPEAKVVDAPTPPKPPPVSHPTEAEPPAPPPPRPAQPKGRLVGPMAVGAAAIFGPGLDSGPWRLGSELYANLALPRVPMFLTLGGSAATLATGNVSGSTVRWFDVSVGAGVSLLGPLSRSGIELRCAALTEYFDVAASTLGRSDTMSRWTFGVQGALAGRLRLAPDLFVTAEVQAVGFSGSTEVRVADVPAGSNANFRYLGSVGLRVLLR
ncbi:MAG: hypothetical protein ABW061_06415 [Polyangiaceae bacterium]